MKRGMTEVRVNNIYVMNEMEEEYVNFVNEEARLYIRSMLEEDIDEICEFYKAHGRERKRILKALKKEESEVYLFLFRELNTDKLLATARLYQTEDMDVYVKMDKGLNKQAVDLATSILVDRIKKVVDSLYIETRADGIITIHRFNN